MIRLRLALLALLIVGLLVAGKLTGVGARFSSTAGIRELTASAGAWGVLILIAAFTLGQLLFIPATLFFVAATLAYGRVAGAAVSYGAALLSVSASFGLARALGGQPLAQVKNARMRRLLGGLEARPLTTVIVLRTVFWAAPALNYALALSPLGFRHYLTGSALGLIAPIAAVSALAGVFFH